MDTPGGVAVAVLLIVGIDQVSAVEADPQFGKRCPADPAFLELVVELVGNPIPVGNNLIVEIFHWKLRLQTDVLIGHIARHFGQGDGRKPGEAERIPAWDTAVQAAEIAVEKAVFVQEHDHPAGLVTVHPAKGAIDGHGFLPLPPEMFQVEAGDCVVAFSHYSSRKSRGQPSELQPLSCHRGILLSCAKYREQLCRGELFVEPDMH